MVRTLGKWMQMAVGTRSGLLIVLALLLGSGSSASFAEGEGEWVREYDGVLPGAEPVDGEGWSEVEALLIVSEDGRPLADAEVRCTVEPDSPRVADPALVAAGRTDRYGIVNLKADAAGGQNWVVTAPGYAPAWESCRFGALERTVWSLYLGRDLTFRVIDPTGEPLAGATVEYVVGCPHTPPVRSVVSDERGLVRLTAVESAPEIWIRAPGVSGGPYSVRGPGVSPLR